MPRDPEEPVSDEIFQAMRKSVIDGAPDTAAKLARESIEAGVNPLDAINLGYVEGITYVGEKFGCREMFLPDMLAAAEAMKAAVSVLEPEMKKQGSHREVLGKVVLGTAKGDIHDIGKNLVGTMLSASGFEVFDLGTNVPADKFVDKAKAVDADIVGVSALLTTTMAGQKTVIEALEKDGLRSKVKVIIGGAAVTSKWATDIGADGYARNAVDALDLAKRLVIKSEVPA
jgi:corrinoid protein of di/trimethylamine methyltransferase